MNRPRAKGHLLWLAPFLAGAYAVDSAAQEFPDIQFPSLQPPAAAGGESGEDQEPTGSSEVRVSEYMTVDIVIQNDSITNVLHKLAVQARRNIVPSAAVDRIVNATIYDVPFYDALEGLLQPNGLGFVERGEFIYVYTNEEMAALKLDKWQPVTRIIHLDYLRPTDARDYVIKMLSPDGHIEVTKDIQPEGAGGGAAGAAAGYGGAVAAEGTEDEVYTPELDEFSLTNAIVVQDLAENVDRIESFLRELDTPPAQVLIEATIVQTRLNEANAFGVDFALLTDNAFVDFFNAPLGGVPIGFKTVIDEDSGNLTEPVLPKREGFVVSAPGNVAGGDATIKAGYIGSEVGVFIRALDEVTDVTLLSNPKILTLNRQRAKVFVGTKVGYLETTVVENQVLQTIEYIDAGIILDIRPYILRDGRIRLELAPKVSDVVFRVAQSTDGVVQEIPDERIQTISTDVLVPAGYTAVIGGLFREDTTRSRKQVPLLGDIPLAGAAFRGHDDSTEQSEVIFLIKPTILKEEVAIEQGQRGEEYGERVRVGSRLGLLPWSRERQTARLNLQAERLLAAGRPDRALHKIRRSLELYPLQPEVIRMQQELVTDPLWWPTRSYFKRVIDGEFSALSAAAESSILEPAPE
ncbi:MAG: type II secretion system protein GspD [Planctomycetota bacterium]|jgi:type IV pilus assembly protein PilQ